MRLPFTIFVDDDVETKLPPPPVGKANVDIEVRLQLQQLQLTVVMMTNLKHFMLHSVFVFSVKYDWKYHYKTLHI